MVKARTRAADGSSSPIPARASRRRREARLAVAVLRDGSRACAVRLRAADAEQDALLVGGDLVPNLAEALLETFS